MGPYQNRCRPEGSQNAKGVQKNVIGAVLNKVDMKQIKLYDKYHAAYQQYNDQYSARG